jgi:hypothetical protein
LKLVCDRFSNFDPIILKILAKAQNCIKWTTATGALLKGWTSKSGKAVLLGDAAHAMVPDAGQVWLYHLKVIIHSTLSRKFPGSYARHRRLSGIGRISF